jgi:hypothetical protein
VEGAPVRPQGSGTSLGVTLDFVRNEIRLRLNKSETVAQEIEGTLRKNISPGALAARLRSIFAEFTGAFQAGAGHELVRVVLDRGAGAPALPRELTADVRRALERRVGARVVDWGWTRLVEHLQRSAAEFADVTSQPPDGATCLIRFPSPSGFSSLRRAFQGTAGQTSDWPPKDTPGAEIRIAAGDVRG